jgi:hypothetical protein
MATLFYIGAAGAVFGGLCIAEWFYDMFIW